MQEGLDTLKALGFTWPSPAYILGVIVFGLLGIAAYYYGKRTGRPRTRWLGAALMLYPYVVWQTWLLYLVGIGLGIAIWLDRG
jgi:uncharacterized membrane protein